MSRTLPSAVAAVAASIALVALAVVVGVGVAPAGPVIESVGATAVALSCAYIAWHLDPAYLLCAGIATSVFSGYWGQFGLPASVAPDRLLLIVAIAMVVLRSPGARDRPRFHLRGVHLALTLVLLLVVLSSAWAGTLTDKDSLFTLVDRFGVIPFAAFAVAPLVFHDTRRRRVLLATLVVLGAYLSITAIFEALDVTALVFPRYINDPTLGIHQGRARGPFLEAEAEGMAVFICGTAAMVALREWCSAAARAFAFAVIALSVVAALVTLQRAVWLACVAGAIVMLVGARELRRFIVPTVLVAVVALGAAFVFIPGLSDNVHNRTQGTNADRSVWDRKNLNAAAIRVSEANPVTGLGWGRFRETAEPYFRASPDYPLTGAVQGQLQIVHNMYLSNSAELGIPVTALWLAALMWAVVAALRAPKARALRDWRTGFAGIATMWFVIALLTPLEKPFPNLALWTMAGVLFGARPNPAFSAEEPRVQSDWTTVGVDSA